MESVSRDRGPRGVRPATAAWTLAAAATLAAAGAAPAASAGALPAPLAGAGGEQEGVGATYTVPAGTRLAAALEDTLSTGRDHEGVAMSASVMRPVTVPEGVAVPRGALVYFTPLRLEPSRSLNTPTVIRIRFDSLVVRGEGRPIRATLTNARSTKSSRTSLLVSIGLMAAAAVAGAGAGRWLTGGGGALTGAALAAVAAAVVIMTTQDVDAVIPAGAEIEVRLDEAVEVPAS